MDGTHVRFRVGMKHLARYFFTMDPSSNDKLRISHTARSASRVAQSLIIRFQKLICLFLPEGRLQNAARAGRSGEKCPTPERIPVRAAKWH
jgi:hypothetical protein